MANLTTAEKLKLEYFLQMSGGYLLDFSDRSFKAFFFDNLNIDIQNEKYFKNGTSKANRFRTFCSLEANSIVGKAIVLLLEYRVEKAAISGELFSEKDKSLYDSCVNISERLQKDSSLIDVEVFSMKTENEAWSKVSTQIIESIEKNDPEGVIDRLHTFMIHFFRSLCENHKLLFQQTTPLNSLAGLYINYCKMNNLIESKMGEKILKFGIQILEDFNDIRNNKSLSHANPILNHDESELIFKYITSLIEYIRSIEKINL
jgi:hypothetical protein